MRYFVAIKHSCCWAASCRIQTSVHCMVVRCRTSLSSVSSRNQAFKIKRDSAAGGTVLVSWLTFGQRLHSDLLAVVAVSGSRHRHHPDAVLPVASQVGDSVEVRIWRRLKLAHHLREGRDRGASCTNRASPGSH